MAVTKEEIDGETISSKSPRESTISPRAKENLQPEAENEKGIEIIAFTANDPEDPRNIPRHKKTLIVVIICTLSFAA